jgi:F-type H+-transporting ATPase subunit epsilon
MAVIDTQIVTPEGVVFEGTTEMVIAPGVEGELGVLPRHAPIIARLKPGEVRVKVDGTFHSWATGDGYFKMQQDRATILVEGAEAADQIDVEGARAAAEDARTRLAAADAGDETVDRYRAERDLLYAENRLRIAGR